MDRKEEIKKDIKKFASLDVVASTAGGKLLVSSLQKDITSCVDELSSKYKTASHIEIIAICAKLSEKITLLRVLNKAKKLKKIAQEELNFLLEEEN
jgi:hypothetical protein